MAMFFILALMFLLPLEVATSRIDDEPELAVEQVKQEAVLEVRFAQLKTKYGVADRRTLEVFFELFDLWIMLYRLNKADAALREVVPVCEKRHDDLTIKAVQALAFTRWKQGRYREALSRFHEMEGWIGKSAALSENIGHTYNTIGSYADAEGYFREALSLTDALSAGDKGNRGGILLGLAGVQERRGAYKEALPSSQASYDFYKERDRERGWETSLTAKAAMQLSKVHMKLGSLQKSETFVREALRLFIETAGDDSPLVAGALERLGTVLWQKGQAEEARTAFHGAYKLEAIKDAFDLVSILEIHNALVETHLAGGGLDRAAFGKYFEVVASTAARVKRDLPQDGNAGAYYKAAGELLVLGGDCAKGKPFLSTAAELFTGETVVDTTHLIKQCWELVAYCDGTYDAAAKNNGGRTKPHSEL